MKKKTGVVKKIIGGLTSKRGIVTLGIISLIYILAIVSIFVSANLSLSNPAPLVGPDFVSLRDQVIAEGKEELPFLISSSDYGRKFARSDKVVDNKTYSVYVSTQTNCSDYFGVLTKVSYQDYGLVLGLTMSHFLESAYQADNNYVFYAQTLITKPNGDPYLFYDYFEVNAGTKYACSIHGDLKLEHLYEDEWGIEVDQKIIDEINNNSEQLLRDFFPSVRRVIQSFDANPDKVFAGFKRSFAALDNGSLYLTFGALISVIGGPVTVFFILALSKFLIEKKRKRLVAKGEIQDNANVEELVHIPTGIHDALDLDEPPPAPIKREVGEMLVDSRLDAFCRKTKLRPFFGEWVVRGVGFVFITVASVFIHIVNAGLGSQLLNDAFPWFKMLSAAGQVLLLVALIGIIAETRKNLTFNAALFFAMAITFYLAVNSAFFAVDSIIKYDLMGISLSQFLSSMLPGNIFMSMGLFTFIGFFLFEDPPEWLIKRKVFRALSIIPTGIAIMSVVFSMLWTAEKMDPNYWISLFFFFREVDGLFIGIIYIFEIFIFRTYLGKEYGKENVDDLMEQPSIQFKKNFGLCLIIAIYTILFYSVPTEGRLWLHLPDHTIVYALIPIFLFYKPAGRKRNAISNIVYYALYILSFIIPTVVTMTMR